jgi:hypothetical protein
MNILNGGFGPFPEVGVRTRPIGGSWESARLKRPENHRDAIRRDAVERDAMRRDAMKRFSQHSELSTQNWPLAASSL